MTDIPPHPSALSSVPDTSGPEGRRFVQDRLALFGFVCFLGSSAFFAKEMVYQLGGQVTVPRDLGFSAAIPHGIATALLGGAWLVARQRRTLTPAMLNALDTLVLLATIVAFAAMHLIIAKIEVRYAMISSLLIGSTLLMAHAILVPTPPARALWLNATASVPLVVLAAMFSGELPGAPPWEPFVSALIWCSLFVVLATLASRLLHGLRERVREARDLGQYSLVEMIGEGGMGQVYRAQHAMLRRPTAIKLLPPSRVTEKQLARFEREVQLTAQLTHPNTISVYDFGRTPDGVFYYAMELLNGTNLEDLVDEHGPQPAARVIHILRQVASALSEAHGVGLIHRDIKPANLFLCERGGEADFVKVLDFGLVKEMGGSGDGTSLEANVVAGTPHYLSPEAIRAPQTVDARSDLYALSAVGYFLLTGEPVFTGGTLVEVCASHLHDAPVPPSERLASAVPRDLEAIILRCLEKDPDKRPRNARTLVALLDGCDDAATWRPRDSQKWWDERGGPTPSRRVAHHAPRTLEIDVRDRASRPRA